LGARAVDEEYESEQARDVAEAQANLQQAIHLKRKALRRRRSNEADDEQSSRLMRFPLPQSQAPPPISPLVDIKLQLHGHENEADELDLPYLRLSGDASVQVLKRFLQQKLSKPDAEFQIMHVGEGRLEILPDSIKLSTIVKQRPRNRLKEGCVTLWYRLKDSM